VNEVAAYGLLLQQFIAGLLGKGLEVAHRAGVGRKHAQDLTALHLGQRLFRFQDGQRAVQATGVKFSVDLHQIFLGMC
jgi:hypothetical protein